MDIEIDKTAFNWDYGRDSSTTTYNAHTKTNTSNIIEAQKMSEALKSQYPNYGIYSSPGEWFNIFGKFDVSLDPSAALWWATWDGKDGWEGMTRFYPKFGGWDESKIVGKQYTNESAKEIPGSGGLFNLNVFLKDRE